MSAMVFLIILCVVLAYILFDTSRRNRRMAVAETSTVVQKPNLYIASCEILNQMVKEKHESKEKIRVSFHLTDCDCSVDDLQRKIQNLKQWADLYVIINDKEQRSPIAIQLESMINHKNIFKCKTMEGQLALIRQLNAFVHVETDIAVIKTLKPHLKNVATLSGIVMEDTNILKTSKNVYSYNDLNELLTSIVKLKA